MFLPIFLVLLLSPLLDACLFEWETRKVDTRGRLVCWAHNGSIVPVSGAIVQLKDWETLPLPHGLLLGNTTTDALGHYRISGSNEKSVSPFKFYIIYRLSCSKEGARRMCAHLESVCTKLNDDCIYEKIMNTIDEGYYFEDKWRHIQMLFDAHDVDIEDRSWQATMHCKRGRSTSPEMYPPGR